MGIYNLLFRAQLKGVIEVRVQRDIRWIFRVQCSNCGEDDKEVCLHANRGFRDEDSGGTFNVRMKCKGCSKGMSLKLLKKSVSDYRSHERHQRIAQVDARGLRILAWRTQGLSAYCESGDICEDINTEETKWIGYDREGIMIGRIYEIEMTVSAA